MDMSKPNAESAGAMRLVLLETVHYFFSGSCEVLANCVKTRLNLTKPVGIGTVLPCQKYALLCNQTLPFSPQRLMVFREALDCLMALFVAPVTPFCRADIA